VRAVFSVISICSGAILLMLLAPCARGSVDTSFLNHLNQTIPTAFDKASGISDPLLNKKAHEIWQEVANSGVALRPGISSDKEMGTIFRQLQAHIEYELIENLPEKIPFGDAIIIIHTPAIATPLVTAGELSLGLASAQILSDHDKTRINTALSRAKLMRDFLAKGGIIIATYESDAKNLRTPEQMTIFNALKRQYPQQLIEFPLASKSLRMQPYPLDMIGATYLIKMPSGDIFEMTNRGVQINDTRDEITWGIWLQMRRYSTDKVNQRLCVVFQFLENNGLLNILSRHAKAQRIAPEKYLTLARRYLQIGEPANTTCTK